MKLSEEGVRRELANFFNSGYHFKSELLEPMIQKLHKLYKVIEKQQSFRYYSSSLLLMYDGAQDTIPGENESSPGKDADNCNERSDRTEPPTRKRSLSSSRNHRLPRVDVRMIDFAHTTHSGFSGDRVRTGPDKGYLFGIKNLIRLLEEIGDTRANEGSRKDVDPLAQESSLAAENV